MNDVAARVPLSAWVLFCAIAQLAGLTQYVQLSPIDSAHVIHIGMRLSTITFLWVFAAAVILRTRPCAKAIGLEPRISALAGTFLLYGLALFPRRELTPLAEIVATLLTMVGLAGAAVAICQLGRSFSLMAESRQLVTSGPYRFARHPIYAAEEIAAIGIFMQFASVWTALLLAAQIAFQLRRMHNEETVLNASFPQYEAYRRSTARLIPGLY